MAKRDIIVIGASAGGIRVLVDIVRHLRPKLPACLLAVVPTSPSGPGVLPDILNRPGTLRASLARQGDPLEHGRIYVAPPDHHLLLHRHHIVLSRGPRENGFRPAVDPLFRTAAKEH